jgi:hypothetical protein
MEWRDRPPAPTEFAGIRIGRVQKGKDYEAIITSEAMVGHNTHWYKRRTIPCTAPDCAACCEATPARWHGYLSVWSTRTRIHNVLELTALAAASVAEYADRHGSLRGALLRASRIGNRDNSPVSVTITPHDCDLRTVPRQVDLRRFLETLWSAKTNHDEPTENPPPEKKPRKTLLADFPHPNSQPLPLGGVVRTFEARTSNGKRHK